MNEHQPLTQYIKHLADSADFKGGTLNKLCNGLIGNCFEMPNVSYTHPLWAIEIMSNQVREYPPLTKTIKG